MKRKSLFILIAIIFSLFMGGCKTYKEEKTIIERYGEGAIKFEEMGYFRASGGEKGTSGNGTVRVMTVYVSNFRDDPHVWVDIKKNAKRNTWFYGDVNYIFYFKNRKYTPADRMTLAKDYFTALGVPDSRSEYCVACYYKITNGIETFVKYPKGY